MVLSKFEDILIQKNKVYNRFAFFKGKQNPNGPFNIFFNDLLTLSPSCGFENHKDPMVRDALFLCCYVKKKTSGEVTGYR